MAIEEKEKSLVELPLFISEFVKTASEFRKIPRVRIERGATTGLRSRETPLRLAY